MMDSPFEHWHRYSRLPDELLDRMSLTEDEDEQKRIFLDHLRSPIYDTPYHFWGFVFFPHEDVPFDVQQLALDYIVSDSTRWNPDHVACFLLEVAGEHRRFAGHSDWLLEVELPGLRDLDDACSLLRQLFESNRDDLVIEILNRHGWNHFFAQQLSLGQQEDSSPHEPNNDYFYYSLVRLVESGDSHSPRDDARGIAAALRAKDEGRFYDAIPEFLAIRDTCPNFMPQEIRTALSICYLEVGWRGLALEWLLQALKHDADNLELQELEARILGGDDELLRRLSEEFGGGAPESESLRALTIAEYLYRYYGRMLHDYAPIISGYARGVEIALRHQLLPKVRLWIRTYGKEKNNGRKWIETGKGPLYEDTGEQQVTLGTWTLLFHKKNPRDYKHTPGEFYHCVHKVYGATIDFGQLARFGELLAELKDLRNSAAHETIDWAKARRAREIVIEKSVLSLAP